MVSLASLHPIYATLDYKSNFEKLENLVLIGGPDDGVITPWQSRYIHFVGTYFTNTFSILIFFLLTSAILDFMMKI